MPIDTFSDVFYEWRLGPSPHEWNTSEMYQCSWHLCLFFYLKPFNEGKTIFLSSVNTATLYSMVALNMALPVLKHSYSCISKIKYSWVTILFVNAENSFTIISESISSSNTVSVGTAPRKLLKKQYQGHSLVHYNIR